MLQHVVAITWNDQVPPNYAETVSAVLQEMASHISSVREYHCGPDLGVSTAVNADYLIVATFDELMGGVSTTKMHHTTRFVQSISSHTLRLEHQLKSRFNVRV